VACKPPPRPAFHRTSLPPPLATGSFALFLAASLLAAGLFASLFFASLFFASSLFAALL
jgi:hypothetical protein